MWKYIYENAINEINKNNRYDYKKAKEVIKKNIDDIGKHEKEYWRKKDMELEDLKRKNIENEKKKIYCSECLKLNYDNDYCIDCGHKLRNISNKYLNKFYCQNCGKMINHDDGYCGGCGRKIKLKGKLKKCSVCGYWFDGRYCINCGHDSINRSRLVLSQKYNFSDLLKKSSDELIELRLPKKCPNCNSEHQIFFNYCENCGTKLKKKLKIKLI